MKTTNCLSSCKSRIYNVRVIVIGNDNDVRNFIRDNRFVNDLYDLLTIYNNSPVANAKSRARASRACGGMQSAARPTKEPCR